MCLRRTNMDLSRGRRSRRCPLRPASSSLSAKTNIVVRGCPFTILLFWRMTELLFAKNGQSIIRRCPATVLVSEETKIGLRDTLFSVWRTTRKLSTETTRLMSALPPRTLECLQRRTGRCGAPNLAPHVSYMGCFYATKSYRAQNKKNPLADDQRVRTDDGKRTGCPQEAGRPIWTLFASRAGGGQL